MRLNLFLGIKLAVVAMAFFLHFAAAAEEDPLPSWNPGPVKNGIISFVSGASGKGMPRFIAPEERIAVFDNDGTLWSEQPLYFQFRFALDRVKELAPAHPEWKSQQPFAAVLSGDAKALAQSGEQGMLQILVRPIRA